MKTADGKTKRIAALVLAAGKGKRFGGETPKQFLLLDEEPMLLYALDAIAPFADRILLVTSEEEIDRAEEILRDAGLSSSVGVVAGGAERYESSVKGLEALAREGEFDYVLIHDAARCLLTEDVVGRTVEGVIRYGAVVAAIPSKDTVKTAELTDGARRILSTPDRRSLLQVQTPQAFRTDWITEAYRNAEKAGALSDLTDDASAVERFTDHPVYAVEGSEENFKVTTPFDFMLAETVLTVRRMKRDAERN